MKASFWHLESGSEFKAKIGGRSCTFTTAAKEGDDFSFIFSSCLGGQGYGRSKDGWKIFDEMAKHTPNFFLFTGDTIYADCKIPEVAKLFDGTTRVNIPHDVECRTIDQFRDRYKYQLDDPLYARFLSTTSTYVVWDDHEIYDDWGGGKLLEEDPELLKAGVKAFFEYWPVLGVTEKSPTGKRLYRNFKSGAAEFFILDARGYRDKHTVYKHSNTPQLDNMLGKPQMKWLLTSLKYSNALWKIVVSSVPLSFPTGFPRPEVDGYDGWTADRALFYLFGNIRETGVENLLFITGDVHFPYLLSYDPFIDGTPFCYEVGATPMSAIPLAPSKPDPTLNPTMIWSAGEFVKGPMNFGHVQVHSNGNLKIRFIKEDGVVMFEKTLVGKKSPAYWKKGIHRFLRFINFSTFVGASLVGMLCFAFLTRIYV